MRYITSQLTRVQSIVDTKVAVEDFDVQFVVVEIEGEELGLVIDGHHSHEAAKDAGVEPVMIDVTEQYAAEIEHLGGNRFLDSHNCGEGWWDITTGQPAW